MFEKVLNYKPQEQDYRIWLVLNPATWLVPILASTLVVALAVHTMVFSVPEYQWGAEEAAPVVEAAPAAEAAAPAAEVAPVAAPAAQ